MKRIFVTLAVLTFLVPVTFSASFAAESTPSASVEGLPTVRVLPDNPLYFLKTLKEKVQLVITRSSSDQADLLLTFAQKRLAEALAVSRKGEIHVSEKLFDAFGRDTKQALEKIAEAKAAGDETYDLILKLQKAVSDQKAVLEKMKLEASLRSTEAQERIEALNEMLVQEASDSGKIRARSPERGSGLGIGDWLRSLFGQKEVLRPLVR